MPDNPSSFVDRLTDKLWRQLRENQRNNVPTRQGARESSPEFQTPSRDNSGFFGLPNEEAQRAALREMVAHLVERYPDLQAKNMIGNVSLLGSGREAAVFQVAIPNGLLAVRVESAHPQVAPIPNDPASLLPSLDEALLADGRLRMKIQPRLVPLSSARISIEQLEAHMDTARAAMALDHLASADLNEEGVGLLYGAGLKPVPIVMDPGHGHLIRMDHFVEDLQRYAADASTRPRPSPYRLDSAASEYLECYLRGLAALPGHGINGSVAINGQIYNFRQLNIKTITPIAEGAAFRISRGLDMGDTDHASLFSSSLQLDNPGLARTFLANYRSAQAEAAGRYSRSLVLADTGPPDLELRLARIDKLAETLAARDQLPMLRRAGNYELLELDASRMGIAHQATEQGLLLELGEAIRIYPPGTTAYDRIHAHLIAGLQNGTALSNDRLGRSGVRLEPNILPPETRAAGLLDKSRTMELPGEEVSGWRAAVIADAEAVAEAGRKAKSGNAVVSIALLVGVPLLGSLGVAQAASPSDIMGSLQKAVNDHQMSQTEANALARDMMMLQAIGIRPDPITRDTVAKLRKDMNDILNKHPGISKEFSDGFNRLITTLSGEQHAENIAPQHFAAATPKPTNQLG